MEISVIVTNYNYGRYLARAIRSLLSQTYDCSEYEIIVIDDCSTDNSKQIINSFGNRIVSIFNDKNLGLATSCNKAIKHSIGKYILRLDADDYVHKDCLKVHQLFISHNKKDIDATSSDYYEVDKDENIITRMCGNTYPIACGVLYKTDDMMDLGLYNEKIPREDFEFRRRFIRSGRRIYNIPIPLYRYFQHNGSITKP